MRFSLHTVNTQVLAKVLVSEGENPEMKTALKALASARFVENRVAGEHLEILVGPGQLEALLSTVVVALRRLTCF